MTLNKFIIFFLGSFVLINSINSQDFYDINVETGVTSDIIINEFLAASENCCGNDIFNGNSEDFIELYNVGADPININGWGFSDTDGLITTTAPDTSIVPGEFLVLWYTGDNNGFPEVNEKLSSNGETIYIADADGNTIISYYFGSQTDDVSFGRIPDGSDEWVFMNPTPGSNNTGELIINDDIIGISRQYTLHQNYPNPFNPVTTLRYDLPENAMINITIYDMLGRRVKTLMDQPQDAGYRSVIWDATNDYGKPVSAGIYLYQIQAGEYISTKKMVLLK